MTQASHIGAQTGPIEGQHLFLAGENNRLTRQIVRAREKLAELIVVLNDLPTRSVVVKDIIDELARSLE